MVTKAQIKTLNEAAALITHGRELVEEVRDDIQSEFDDKSVKWQESEKGEKASEEVEELTTIADSIDAAESDLGAFIAETGA